MRKNRKKVSLKNFIPNIILLGSQTNKLVSSIKIPKKFKKDAKT